MITFIQFVKGEIPEFVEAKDDNSEKSGRKKWSETLDLIKENPYITRKELSEKLRINPSAIQMHIQKLKADGIIERVGGDKGGYWKIN